MWRSCLLLSFLLNCLLDASYFNLSESKYRVYRNSPFWEYWEHWKFFHEKSYSSRVIENQKFLTWVENFLQVYRHNKIKTENLSSYSQRLNEFADLTFPEFKKTMLGAISWPEKPKERKAEKLKVPKRFDWREKGAVTPVKHQLQCGNGWAFAAAGTHEGNLFLEQGKLVNLSAQQILDCTPGSTCRYGSTTVALGYVAHNGLTSDDEYPYIGQKSSCSLRTKTVITENNRFAFLLSQTERQLQTMLYQNGPIAVNIHVTKDFVFYHSGVYLDINCMYNKETNHAVLVVGYGTDLKGGDYWLIKNSWGTEWGMGGYAKMARNTPYNCGIATAANMPDLRKSN